MNNNITKEERTRKTWNEHPELSLKRPRKIKYTTTPEMIKKIVQMFSDYSNTEIAEAIGLPYEQVSIIVVLLRKKGIKLEKKIKGIKSTFENAYEEYQQSLNK